MQLLKQFPMYIAAALVLAATIATQPQTFWQGEEVRFAQSLLTFDPVLQQPEQPGYPLYVAIGRFLNFFLRQPFRTLLALSLIASVAGACLTARAATRLLGDEWLGGAAAIVLFGSPAMLVFAPLPNAQATGVAFVAAAMLWGGAFAGAAAGVLPQTFPAVAVFGVRRLAAAFFVTLAFVFIPFFAETPRSYFARRVSEAANMPLGEVALRFVAHPWGPKWMSIPLLLIAAIGVVVLIRRAGTRAAPLILLVVIHLTVCFLFADRAYGVEPVIPALVAIAIFAAAALSRWPRVAFAVAIVYAAAGFAYAWPLLHVRHTMPSPPARAMRYAREVLPHNAVLLVGPVMEPWARLSRFDVHPLADFDRYADRPDIPLFMLADSASRASHAVEFSWPDMPVYGKVTTRRFRVASLIEFPPAMRYRSLRGIYEFESLEERGWRWIAGDAAIALPRLAARTVHLRLALPDDAPVASNTIAVDGMTVTVARGQSVDVAFSSAPVLRFHAAQTFTPPHDTRVVSVQLLAVEQR